MLSSKLLKEIKLIEIRARKLAGELFAGSYKSVFHGQGVEYSDVRTYQEGDSIRFIDWNIMARSGRLMVKKFQEEREHTLILTIDQNSLLDFGSRKQTKKHLVATFAASIALSAVKNNDRVGLIIFGKSIIKFLGPQKGKAHVFKIIQEILSYQNSNQPTNFHKCFSFLGQKFKKTTVTFMISDHWVNLPLNHLQALHERHDIIAVSALDLIEKKLPKSGIMKLIDPTTKQILRLDLGNSKLRDAYKKNRQKEKQNRENQLKKYGIDHITIMTHQSLFKPLLKFFYYRQQKTHR